VGVGFLIDLVFEGIKAALAPMVAIAGVEKLTPDLPENERAP
jgi:hypothetical protein